VIDAYQVKRISFHSPCQFPLHFLFVWNGTWFYLLHRLFWPAVAYWRTISHPCWYQTYTDVLSIWDAVLDLDSENSLVPRRDMTFASVSKWAALCLCFKMRLGAKTMAIVYEPSTTTLYMTTGHDRTHDILKGKFFLKRYLRKKISWPLMKYERKSTGWASSTRSS